VILIAPLFWQRVHLLRGEGGKKVPATSCAIADAFWCTVLVSVWFLDLGAASVVQYFARRHRPNPVERVSLAIPAIPRHMGFKGSYFPTRLSISAIPVRAVKFN